MNPTSHPRRGPRQALCLLLLCAGGLALARPVVAGGASTSTLRFEHQGRVRTCQLVVPSGHDKARAVPLVLALHGGGGTGEGFDAMTNGQFARAVQQRGWIVAFPQGVAKGWNDGRPLVSWRDRRRANVDDVDFLRQVIDRVQASHNVDPTRVYATGISNGGFMSLRLGLELSDRIAAVAPVTATLPVVHAGKQPAHPVGLLVINGTRDPLVPYEGGEVRVLGRGRGRILSTRETIQHWVSALACPGEPEVTQVPDADPRDGTRTVRKAWAACAGGAHVCLYRVEEGGHTWPGGKPYLPEALIGKVSRDFDAVPKILDFFALHQRAPTTPPAAPGAGAGR